LVDIGRQALYRLMPPLAGATRTQTRTRKTPSADNTDCVMGG